MKATSSQQAHRSGPLKQQNKSHKTGRHRSKSQIENEKKGTYGFSVFGLYGLAVTLDGGVTKSECDCRS